jgi:serine/threonine protein kinase
MDLKPQNVLIDIVKDRPTCVLTDFGITRILSEELLSVHAFQVTDIRGVSLRYASPESIEIFRRKLTVKHAPAFYAGIDMYSIGSIFFYLACNVHPWE